jgi:hypothetical protein
MKCRKFTSNGAITKKCCQNYGFLVDPKTVVIDPNTGKVTHASPLVEDFKNV